MYSFNGGTVTLICALHVLHGIKAFDGLMHPWATCNTGIVHPLVLVTIFTVPKVKIPLWVLKPDKRTSTDSFFHDSEIKSSFPTRSTELVTVQSVHVQELPNCLEYTIFCHSYKSVGVQLARIVVGHSLWACCFHNFYHTLAKLFMPS